MEGRDLSKNVDVFKKSCDKLRSVMENIKSIKDSGKSAESVGKHFFRVLATGPICLRVEERYYPPRSEGI